MAEKISTPVEASPPVAGKSTDWVRVTLAVIIGLILLAASGYAGYWYGIKSAERRMQSAKPQPKTQSQEVPKTTAQPATGFTANWKVYRNTRYGYEVKYPPEFEIVKGPVPEDKLPMADSISFSGRKKPNDPNSGVVFGINVDPRDKNGNIISCSDNEDCLSIWMRVLGKTPDEVDFVSANILGANRKGFEYTNENPLYTQRNMYFVFPYKNKVLVISSTINSYSKTEIGETDLLFNQILSTFRFFD